MLFSIDIGDGSKSPSNSRANSTNSGAESRGRASPVTKEAKEIVMTKLGTKDFEILTMVGKGTFGSVHLALCPLPAFSVLFIPCL